jgi:hypothetical protein
MEAAGLITSLSKRGIRLYLNGDRVGVAPASRLTNEDRHAIQSLKPELVRMLRSEILPIVTLDHIGKIVDGLEAQFLGIKARGWVPPEPEQPAFPESVVAEVRRVLPVLNEHGWSSEAQQKLPARIQPGDKIVTVTSDFLLIAARRPRTCYRVWRADA